MGGAEQLPTPALRSARTPVLRTTDSGLRRGRPGSPSSTPIAAVVEAGASDTAATTRVVIDRLVAGSGAGAPAVRFAQHPDRIRRRDARIASGTAASVTPAMTVRRTFASPTIRRTLKIDAVNKGKPLTNAKDIPPMPDAIRGRFVPAVVDAASQLVRTWCEEKQAHPFATVDALWNAAVDAVAFAPSPAQKPGAENDPWKKLGGATKQSGTVSAMNWAEFGPNAAASLAQELMQCAVQVSSNPDTTAFHGNAHGKLPRKIAADLADLPPAAQAAGTPYIEFLIPGHKKDYGIERGILDRERGLIYITAHYDTGSFVRLTGVPANVVADWQAKALRYAQDAQATDDD